MPASNTVDSRNAGDLQYSCLHIPMCGSVCWCSLSCGRKRDYFELLVLKMTIFVAGLGDGCSANCEQGHASAHHITNTFL